MRLKQINFSESEKIISHKLQHGLTQRLQRTRRYFPDMEIIKTIRLLYFNIDKKKLGLSST